MGTKLNRPDPCVVNIFDTEAEAIEHAIGWSKNYNHDDGFTVIHAPTEKDGLKFFVEEGDGGMIGNNDRLVGSWIKGKKVDA